MATTQKKQSKSGAMGFLTRKELGLPIWAWAIIVAVVAFFAYRYFSGKSSGSSSSTSGTSTTPDTTGTAADTSGDTSGGGSGDFTPSADSGVSDISGQLSDIEDALANLSYSTGGRFGGGGFGVGAGGFGQGFVSPGEIPAGQNPSATTPVAGLGPLSWGGTDYTSRAQFDAYLKSNGLSVAQFATNHPAAYAHYLALPAGVAVTKGVKTTAPSTAVKSGISTAAKVAQGVASATAKTIASGAKPVKAATTKATKSPIGLGTVIKTGARAPSALLQPNALRTVAADRVVQRPKQATKAPAKAPVTKPAVQAKPIAAKPVVKKPPAKAKK